MVTRRRALQLTAASVLGVTLGAYSFGGSSDMGEQPNWFWRVIAEAAQRQDPKLTASAAEAELASIGSAGDLSQPSEARRRVIQQRITDDFTAGRTLLVQGWLLARTEVLSAVVIVGRDR